MGKRDKTVPADREITAAIGEYLKKVRKEKGYTIKKISEILMQKYSDDVSANMLGKTERGEAKISVRLFLELCDLFMLNFYNFHFIFPHFQPIVQFDEKLKKISLDKDCRELIDFLGESQENMELAGTLKLIGAEGLKQVYEKGRSKTGKSIYLTAASKNKKI